MSTSLFGAATLTLLTAISSSTAEATVQPARAQETTQDKAQDEAATVKRLIENADGDAEQLWKVYDYCEKKSLSDLSQQVLEAIVATDSENEKARELLGHVRWDLDWIPEAEVANAKEGQFWCGDKWLDAAEADAYHATLDTWWRMPSEHFAIYSTNGRQTSQQALNHMEYAYNHVVRIFGVTPENKMAPSIGNRFAVVMLNGIEQYNQFAGLDPAQGYVTPEWSGYSACHYAFTCESWVDTKHGEYPGAACGYWDPKTAIGNFHGPRSMRDAAAHAFVEAIDPSPAMHKRWLANPSGQFDARGFWSEKKLPMWMRYGAGSFAGRFVLEDWEQNPDWVRKYGIEELKKAGGLVDMAKLFAFEISSDDPANAARLINQAGLVMAFIVDGQVPGVQQKHRAFKQAMKSGEKLTEAILELQEALVEHDIELRDFAGLPAPAPEEEAADEAEEAKGKEEGKEGEAAKG